MCHHQPFVRSFQSLNLVRMHPGYHHKWTTAIYCLTMSNTAIYCLTMIQKTNTLKRRPRHNHLAKLTKGRISCQRNLKEYWIEVYFDNINANLGNHLKIEIVVEGLIRR